MDNALCYLKTKVFQVHFQNVPSLPCQAFTKSPQSSHLIPHYANPSAKMRQTPVHIALVHLRSNMHMHIQQQLK